MKGLGKPHIKNIKQFFKKTLTKMIGDSNEQAKTRQYELESKLNTLSTRQRAQGERRHGDELKFHRRTKPLYGGMAHGTSLHGMRHSVPAPYQDQVRALEKRIGYRIDVRVGQCFIKGTDYKVDINATEQDICLMFYGSKNDDPELSAALQ